MWRNNFKDVRGRTGHRLRGRDRLVIITGRVQSGGQGGRVVEILDSIQNLIRHPGGYGGVGGGGECSGCIGNVL